MHASVRCSVTPVVHPYNMPDALSDAFVLCSSDLCQSAYRVSSAEPSGADAEGVIGGGPLAWIAGVKHLCRVSV